MKDKPDSHDHSVQSGCILSIVEGVSVGKYGFIANPCQCSNPAYPRQVSCMNRTGRGFQFDRQKKTPRLLAQSGGAIHKGVLMDNQIVPQSNSDWQTFKFGELEIHGKLHESGEPVFIASEVCAALGLSNVSRALTALDADEKVHVTKRNETSGRQGILAITESGLYHLVFKSQKEEAQSFKRWITHDVLPAIRNARFYASPSLSSLDVLKQMVNVLDEIQHKQGQMALELEDIHEELLDRDYHTILQWTQRQHIASTPALRQMWGKVAKAESLARNIEIKEANEGAYNVGRYHKSVLLDTCVAKAKTHGQLRLPNDTAPVPARSARSEGR